MTAAGLAHQAFFYDGPEQFAEAMAPVVRDGAERGDRVVVAAKRESADALRGWLGGTDGQVELHDTRDWHPRPVDRLMAVQQAIAELEPGARLLALGEPIWDGSEAVRREWARYESMINVALADAPLRFICLYDRSELPANVLGHGLGTHPDVVEGAAACACAAFEAPDEFVRELDEGGRASPGRDSREIAFDGDPHAFRARLAAVAQEWGMGAARVEELVLATNEVTANAVLHGAPPVAVSCWVADGDFVCEVTDGGPGVADPFSGWNLPAPGARSGWGLALARRVCDALEVADTHQGSQVRLYASLTA